jgi:hypothetical protein
MAKLSCHGSNDSLEATNYAIFYILVLFFCQDVHDNVGVMSYELDHENHISIHITRVAFDGGEGDF